MTVTMTGYISVPASRLEAIRAALPDHIRLTRAEPGCVSFDVTEDDTTPGRFPRRFNVHEIFLDAQSFHAHQTRAAQSVWATITQGIPRTYQVTGI
ncbi:MAG: antibiotic biosynthesis monooxygenase [Pelagimonas sp.]|jgi:quinol monooxygenase YgiN|nr:antibiotic biosynthesis monooxygenase [Pelagimonas sp.]